MQIWFIVSLIFALIVAVFAAVNSDVVTISLIFAKYELSQSVVIIISAVIGAIIAFLFSLVGKFKSAMKTRELNAAIKTSEAKVSELETKLQKCEAELSVFKGQATNGETSLKSDNENSDSQKK